MTDETQSKQAQQQKAVRLETIFMPHARKQRDEVYKNPDRPKRFVHYTSADAALKIIASKRVWLRNTTCMSDYRDVQHGFDLLNAFFGDKARLDSFTDALEKCAAGAAQEAITLFNLWLPDIRMNTFIASLSEHEDKEDLHGRLSMWRAFGTNAAARVAIVMDIPKETGAASALNIIFSVLAETRSDSRRLVERSGFAARRCQAAIIFSFAIGIASRNVCIGVFPKHQRP